MKLNEIWGKILSSYEKDQNKAVATRIEWNHTKELWVGIKPGSFPFFAVEVNLSEVSGINQRNLPDFLSFECEIKNNFQKDFLEIRLRNIQSYDLFLVFMKDILEFASLDVKENLASSIIARIFAWDGFFVKGRVDSLSREELLGLWGELLFLEEIFKKYHDKKSLSVRAWQNDSGKDKDFRFRNCSVEVKTTTLRSNSRFCITSETQLMAENDQQLYLAGFILSPDVKDTRRIDEIISSCRSHLKDVPELYLFNTKILSIGYLDEHAERYSEYRFGIHKMYFFEVDNEFPVIHKSKLNPAISNVTYELDPEFCKKWIKNSKEVLDGIN